MFAGEGHKLGNPAPNVTESNPSSTVASPTAPAATAAPAVNENAAHEQK